MAPATASRLDSENPWPGLASFSELDVDYFHGRDAESAELLRLVRRESVTVLFGGSGLGKTSLLNAGLFPALRDQGFVPAYVRVDFSAEGPTPRTQVLNALMRECHERGIDARQPTDSESLWEYFHSLNTEFWNARNRPVTPVIALDQFEEVFTLGQMNEQTRVRAREFLVELGDLIENRTPQHLKAELDEDPELASRFDFRKTDFKLSLSFREDYLAHIEGLKHQIPSLTYNRLRITPMNGAQALEVVLASGGHLVEDGVAAIIIGMAAGTGTAAHPPDPADYAALEIDPALLSVICSELNGRRQRNGEAQITKGLISGAEHEILADFYERSMAGRDPRVRIFVEDELLTDKGYRDSFARDDAVDLPGITAADLDELVAGRLLRVDDRFGVQRLELTHDVLTKVVRDSRDSRQAREREAAAQVREREAARRQRRNLVFSMVLALGFVAVLAGAWYVLELQKTADEASARAIALQKTADAASARATELQKSATELLRRAQATQLVTQAEQLQDSRFDLSLLLNVEAARRVATFDVRAGYLRRLQSHPHLEGFLPGNAALLSVAFDPKGRFIAAATASAKGTIQLWDVSTRTAMGTLSGYGDTVLGIAISPDGKLLASAHQDATVILWDVAAGERIDTLSGHTDRVLGVAFSPDGNTLASASYDGTLRLWDVATRVLLRTSIKAHDGKGVLGIAYRPDGTMLASAGDDQTAVLWDTATLEPLRTLPGDDKKVGHKRRVYAVAFSPDGMTLASAGGDKQVKLWNPDTGQLVNTLKGYDDAVRSVAFSANGQHLATASDDTVQLWDAVETNKLRDAAETTKLLTLKGHVKTVQSVVFSPSGALLASVGDDGNLILWNPAKVPAKRIASENLAEGMGKLRDVSFSRDGTRIAAAGDDGKVILWDVDKGKQPVLLEGHERRVRKVAFGAHDRQLISAGNDKALIVWELATGNPERRIPSDRTTLALAYSADGTRAASGGRDKAVTLWDTATWEPVGTLKATHWVWAVSFSPDGKRLAVAQNDKTVSLWDIQTRTQLATLRGHDKRVRDVAFSPDGSLLASASDDEKVILWQVDTHKQFAALAHEKSVFGVAFGPQGKTLASASGDDTIGNVILWDVATGTPLFTLQGHRKVVTSVAVSLDGARIASASEDQTLKLWDWSFDSLATEACRLANRNLSCSEWRQYMGSDDYRKTCDAAPAPRAEDCN